MMENLGAYSEVFFGLTGNVFFFWLGWLACASLLAIDSKARWNEIERLRNSINAMRGEGSEGAHDGQ